MLQGFNHNSFSSFTTIIGRNDSGKSTILDALNIFFEGKGTKIDSDDGCKFGDKKNVRMAGIFSDLPSEFIVDRSASAKIIDEFLNE